MNAKRSAARQGDDFAPARLESQTVGSGVDIDDLDLALSPVNQDLLHRILNQSLQRPAQRAGTVDRSEAGVLEQPRLGGRGPLDAKIAM